MGTVIFNKENKHTGWLGNRMFQVAATMGIAIRNHMNYLFPDSDYYHCFAGKIPTAENLNLKQTINYEEPVFHFTPVKLDPHHNYNLRGYYQSIKYWTHCEDLIRKTFEFRHKDILQATLNHEIIMVETFEEKEVASVSVHVRRGDYLNLPEHHPALSMDYYNACMLKIQELLPDKFLYFLICSDDKEWCHKQFALHIKESKAIIFNSTPADDLCMMSLCDHNIIANSSFSWWGSYLNANPNKIVIAPTKDKWFGKAYTHYNLDDLYLNNWVLV